MCIGASRGAGTVRRSAPARAAPGGIASVCAAGWLDARHCCRVASARVRQRAGRSGRGVRAMLARALRVRARLRERAALWVGRGLGNGWVCGLEASCCRERSSDESTSSWRRRMAIRRLGPAPRGGEARCGIALGEPRGARRRRRGRGCGHQSER